ncbi:hypothetical protein SUGI_0132130 [Cryptomeria japonica]|nr:hypothetical protein SUGI_0132130 [Cryptomeria japonica]
MDDKVHVRGLPTGNSSFKGLGIFSPQLWKCTGYVPKSMNFQYREFPCWDEEKENVETQEEIEQLQLKEEESAKDRCREEVVKAP